MCGGIEYQDQKIYFPQPDALLPVRLRDGHVTWIPLDTRMAIQGLLAERDNEMRLYVVIINTPPEYAWIHDRWPRLVRLKNQ